MNDAIDYTRGLEDGKEEGQDRIEELESELSVLLDKVDTLEDELRRNEWDFDSVPSAIVKAVLHNLFRRRGFDHLWDNLDRYVKIDIASELEGLVEDVIASPVLGSDFVDMC